MRRNFLLLAYIFSLWSVAWAQSVPFIGFKAALEYPVAHHKFLSELLPKQSYGYHLRLGMHSGNNRIWQMVWNLPDYGLGLYYSNLNSDTVGSVWATYFFTDVPLVHTRQFSLMFNFNLGAGYGTRPFDSTDNPYNLFYSTKLNIFAVLGFSSHVHLRWFDVFYGIYLSHISNGGQKMPNYGLNRFGYMLGMNVNLHKRTEFLPAKIHQRSSQLYFCVSMAYAKHQYTEYEPQFSVYELSTELFWEFNPRFLLNIGAEMTYNLRAAYLLGTKGLQIVQLAPVAGFGFVFNRVNIGIKAGYRLRNFDYYDFYQVYELRFKLPANLWFLLKLNSYYFNAQYFGLGFGFYVPLKTAPRS